MTSAADALYTIQDNKSAIAQAFNKAASGYDQHAAFQRDVGQRLLDKLPQQLDGWRILDLGCGTGYCSQALQARGATVVCVDLSSAMLQQAYQRCGSERMSYLQADGEALPFASSEFDAVFSSLALQWCKDLTIPLREIQRVLKPHGQAYIATLLEGSLAELQQAWLKVDAYQHVNHFMTINQVKIALAQAGYQKFNLDLPAITMWYKTAFALMRDLKGIGANHVQGRFQGLTRRCAFIQVEQAYQQFANSQGLLPATYQVCLGVLHQC